MDMQNALGLSGGQAELVYNSFSFAVAAMGIAFVYFLVSRNRVAPAYRSALTMSAMICGIAAYHYWRMFSNYSAGTWNEGYRYADWQNQHDGVRAVAPLRRSGTPEDCVDAVLGLVRSRYATGQVLLTDGGLSLVM